MKKYVKFVLCGMAAAALVTGCSSNKPQESQSTAAETVTEASSEPESGTEAEKEVDRGTVTKLGQYKGVEVKRLPGRTRSWMPGFRVFWMQTRNTLRSRTGRRSWGMWSILTM